MRKGISALWEKHSLKVKRISAARAIFESEEVQRVEFKVTTEYTDAFTLELTPQQTAQFIQELTIAYESIFPPIRRNRYRE